MGKVIDNFINRIFSLKKATIYLGIIFLLGFILRLIAAINLGVSADDMHFVTHAIDFFSSGKLVTYDQSAGLWFSFTSIIYNILGVTNLASRTAALVFGSFSILVIYLLSRKFFSEKTSLIAAFLLAIAPFHIKLTIAEQDVMAMFFVLMSMLFFVRAVKSEKVGMFALSGLFMGLGVYTKVYPLLFIPSLLIYFAYAKRKSKQRVLTGDSLKKILVFLAVIFLFTLPALTHNYLLYKDKGILDLQFTRTLGLGKENSAQYYAWDAQFDAKNSWKGLLLGDTKHVGSGEPLLYAAVRYIWKGDPVNFALGILGLALILFKARKKIENYDYLTFFILSIAFVLPFLASIILLPKHYLFLEILLIPAGAFFVNASLEKVKIYKKLIGRIVLILLLMSSLIYLGLPGKGTMTHFYGKSHITQMMEFKEDDIPANALIVGDSRIYRGIIHWAFHGRPYLEGTEFINILQNQNDLPGETVQIEIYFFECVTDDCGWGTVAEQPEFNASMESLVSIFKQAGDPVREISEPSKENAYYPLNAEEDKKVITRIYKAKIPLKESVIYIATQPKSWFLYPIGYEPLEENFDYYNILGFFDSLLDTLAHVIKNIAIILAFLSPVYVLYLLWRREK